MDNLDGQNQQLFLTFGQQTFNMDSLTFRKELEKLINHYSMEAGSDTPDFILADYIYDCLKNFDKAVQSREKWYGRVVKTCGSPTSELTTNKSV